MKFSELSFTNDFTESLSSDPLSDRNPRQVSACLYSLVKPEPLSNSRLLAVSKNFAQQLGVESEMDHDSIALLSGNKVASQVKPYATRYGGHQFGHWAGQLGDGRAINFGECSDSSGKSWCFQLKGVGLTPYSRQADGRAVVRSSIREFLCSEAMHHLGIPTTRALSLITSTDQVWRDRYYDGNSAKEYCAVVSRFAESFLRFGHFELLAASQEPELLRDLLDYSISRYFSHLSAVDSHERYCLWLAEVARLNAICVADWMSVGFVHGVLNTDNMSILGLTIDYGPYGWLEDFDPLWTPNTTDADTRRYAYERQPQIAWWNLHRLASSLTCLGIGEDELRSAIGVFQQEFNRAYKLRFIGKLGLGKDIPDNEFSTTVEKLHHLLESISFDFTLFFQRLETFPSSLSSERESLIKHFSPAIYRPHELTEDKLQAFQVWLERLRSFQSEEAKTQMSLANPRFVLRNYLAQRAIEGVGNGDLSVLYDLQKLSEQPFSVLAGYEDYYQKRPAWADNRRSCTMLSCSS